MKQTNTRNDTKLNKRNTPLFGKTTQVQEKGKIDLPSLFERNNPRDDDDDEGLLGETAVALQRIKKHVYPQSLAPASANSSSVNSGALTAFTQTYTDKHMCGV